VEKVVVAEECRIIDTTIVLIFSFKYLLNDICLSRRWIRGWSRSRNPELQLLGARSKRKFFGSVTLFF
jgi:hypothetical protein